jgi:hypothetical protein
MILVGIVHNNPLTSLLIWIEELMKKILSILCVCLLMLTGCHHQNPLSTKPKIQSAVFLMNASANTEKRLNFDIRKDEHGYGYLECMEGKANQEIDCNSLYLGMITFAKERHFPGYESLTLADLTDEDVFTHIAEDYYEIMATTWPKYF